MTKTISGAGPHGSVSGTDRIPASKGPFVPGSAGYHDVDGLVAFMKGAFPAVDMSYDNSVSGLTATDVQAAIDEIVAGSIPYAAGTFTPSVTFATPGDLSVMYGVRSGSYVRIGDRCFIDFVMSFSPTFTTAAGAISFPGLPFSKVSTAGTAWQTNLQNVPGWPAGRIAQGSLPNGSSAPVIFGLDYTGLAVAIGAAHFTSAPASNYVVGMTGDYQIA